MSKISDFVRRKTAASCSAVVVAAGSSVRMGEDKLFIDLCGKPVLARTLEALNVCACVNEIIVVVRADCLEKVSALCVEYGISKVSKVVCGGKNRNESALSGLSEIRKDAKIAIIHDGARPFVTEEIVRATVHAAALYKCAAPAIPVTDTIKTASEGCVTGTLDRSVLVAMQTPQAFLPDLIKTALTKAVRDNISYTDDCAAVEALGAVIHLTEGSPENIKITRPLDVKLAEAIMQGRSQ